MDSKLNELQSEWLPQVAGGAMSWEELAERILRREFPADSAHHPDQDRARRCRFGEVIFGEGKSAEAVIAIADRLLAGGQSEVLVTRFPAAEVPSVIRSFAWSRYDAAARTLRLSRCASAERAASTSAQVAVVCAGSTDLPVAREALETLGWMNVTSELLSDVGVAGPYRLLPHLDRLRQACAIVVVAGMEGALASVLGGLVACPVIAVPTSVGYGANLQGVTTLLSMLSSCAAGVTAVNIDAGFKGGYVAGLIAHGASRHEMNGALSQ